MSALSMGLLTSILGAEFVIETVNTLPITHGQAFRLQL